MSPVTRIAELVEQHIGIRRSRVENVARSLREAGMLPKGGPGRAPDFDRTDAIALLVATVSGATLQTVAERTAALLATTPGGANVDGAPLSIPRTAEIQLAVLANMAAKGDTLKRLTVEIVVGWPEVALIWDDGAVQRFQTAGTITNNRPSHAARWAVRIPGPALAAFIKDLANG